MAGFCRLAVGLQKFERMKQFTSSSKPLRPPPPRETILCIKDHQSSVVNSATLALPTFVALENPFTTLKAKCVKS